MSPLLYLPYNYKDKLPFKVQALDCSPRSLKAELRANTKELGASYETDGMDGLGAVLEGTFFFSVFICLFAYLPSEPRSLLHSSGSPRAPNPPCLTYVMDPVREHSLRRKTSHSWLTNYFESQTSDDKLSKLIFKISVCVPHFSQL